MQEKTATPFYGHARDVAVEAAYQAARIIRRYAGQIEREHIREKGVHDLVTHADEEAQHAIIQALKAAFPTYDILAEEGAEDQPARHANGHRWIVDPIDGTTNFTHGVPPYAVSIALQHEAELCVGVVLDVARDELFTAIRGDGLFVNGRRAQVSQTQMLADSLLTTGFPYRAFKHADTYLEVLHHFMHKTQDIRRPGAAAVDLAYVACGRFDGFFETGLKPWDVAAGTLLVEEGGGRVSDYYGEPNPVFENQILASNGLIHKAMRDVLQIMRDVRD